MSNSVLIFSLDFDIEAIQFKLSWENTYV